MLPWLLRGFFALVVFGLALAALGSASLLERPAPTPVVIEAAAAPRTQTPMPAAPTYTPEPFIQRITSRISRETQVPYPTATPFSDGFAHVSVVDFGYMPSVIRIRPGQTVVWRNDGREEHDVWASDWYSGALEPTFEYRQTFGLAGTYNYRCSIHPDMVGAVIVLDQ